MVWMNVAAVVVLGLVCAAHLHAQAKGEPAIPTSSTWYWLNYETDKQPACALVQSPHSPITWLEMGYGIKNIKVAQSGENPNGKFVVFDLPERGGMKSIFVSTEAGCYHWREAQKRLPRKRSATEPTWHLYQWDTSGRHCEALTETPYEWISRVYGNAPRKLREGANGSAIDTYEVQVMNGKVHAFSKSKASCEQLAAGLRELSDLQAKRGSPGSGTQSAAAALTEGGAKRLWYAADLNSANCIVSISPASRIRMIQDAGVEAKFVERLDAVEVSAQEGGRERYWTYYRSQGACEATLPRLKSLPKHLE
jgi:hypothetical protein